MGGARSTYREEERFIKGLVGNTERKIPLGRSMRGCENNIKMYLQDVEWGVWTDLAQNLGSWWKYVNPAMNLPVPHNVWNFLTSIEPVTISRSSLLYVVKYVSAPHNTLHLPVSSPIKRTVFCPHSILMGFVSS
jgi:hypothetical protein